MKLAMLLAAVAAGGLMIVPASANFLQNGDFDTGTLEGWTQHSEAFPAVPAPGIMTSGGVHHPQPNNPTSGSYLVGISHGGNLGGGNAALYQTVSVPDGVPLTLSLDVAGGVGGMGNFDGAAWWEVRVIEGGWTNPDGGSLLWKRELTTEGAGFGWEHVSEPYTSNTGEVTVVLKYGAWDPAWDWTYFGAYFDSVSLVPEPASVLLLALGLPLLRRRR